jgi:glycerate kinase
MPRVVACPDSLKGVLTAAEAAAALAAGLREAGADADELPLADGGEGTAAALHAALGGEWRGAVVPDPIGRPVDAQFLLLPAGVAVVEVAAAIGLPLLQPHERDPLRASSEGVGELLLAAAAAGARDILVTLGGSATVDGGAGIRRVLAFSPLPPDVRLRAACDVRNPLLGPRGAARAFGPQKGATPEQVEELERRLAALPELRPYAELPGAGAAGGLGAAFAALGAELVPGARLVLETVGFAERVAGAALAVTGEGRVDATSLEGKVPSAVVSECVAATVPCVVFGGLVDPEGHALLDLGASDVVALSGVPRRARADLVQLGRDLGARV